MIGEDAKSMPVILDTSVLVAAFRSNTGASSEVLRLALEGSFEIAASTAVFLEYEDVLQRPAQRLAHGRSIQQVDRFLAFLSGRIFPVEIYFRWRPQLRDADDEMVLDAAVNARVDAIITHNRKDFISAATRFKIEVYSPSQFLREVKP